MSDETTPLAFDLPMPDVSAGCPRHPFSAGHEAGPCQAQRITKTVNALTRVLRSEHLTIDERVYVLKYLLWQEEQRRG